MSNTIFEYLYRDASNYKAHGAVLLDGRLDEASKRKIQDRFERDEYFVADQLGVPDRRPKLWDWSGGRPNEDDHSWHEFSGFRDATIADQKTLGCWGSVGEFVERALRKDYAAPPR